MLSFSFTEEQEALRATLLDYARTSLLPAYNERAKQDRIPASVRKEVAQLGVLGIGLPAEYGGTGVNDPVTLGVATEALAYGDVNVASMPIQGGLIGDQLSLLGDKDVRRDVMTALIAGDIEVAIALTEPDSGSDAAALRTIATPVDGGWLLTGEKTSITQAISARYAVTYARSPGSERGRGVSAFLVDLEAEGVEVTGIKDMGMRPLGPGYIAMTDVFVPESHLIGDEGAGFSQVMDRFDFSRAAIGLMCLGAAERSLDEASEYARQRTTFGKPIASYQGISFPIAEHLTLLEGARWVCYRTLWLREAGERHTAEAAMSKWWAPRVAKDAIETAITTMGHGGYSEELPLQARFRDVFGYLVADGTAEIQKLIIARERIGPEVRA